eukprot:CAMPEP_0178876036 /NCGR_PEP_ID=MMETSP0747-20121128/10080_1 /TAXON_ID=913974 /ORGANISM="Nitzschia punctata, Strain CCMP561" /LENGTH=506 /DNA_ID=CAMNT_0020543565 /DNA_START=147 /DNA_END=1667 /DNA_ORIENTATION=+
MTFPPFFPHPPLAERSSSPLSVGSTFTTISANSGSSTSCSSTQESRDETCTTLLKPRLSQEDEEGAYLLLGISSIVSKELRSWKEREEPPESSVSSPPATISCSSSCPPSAAATAAADFPFVNHLNHPTRTVSMDEESCNATTCTATSNNMMECDLQPPAYSHSQYNHHHHQQQHYQPPPSHCYFPPMSSSFMTPTPYRQSSPEHQHYHHHHERPSSRVPAVITPVVTMKRPVISFSTPTSTATRSQPQPTQVQVQVQTQGPQDLQDLPKLPPLLGMKRQKKTRTMFLNKNNNKNHYSSSPTTVGTHQSTTSGNSNNDSTVKEEAHPANKNSNNKNNKVHSKKQPNKKFSWKNYPELEDFLIANRPEYLAHAARNYTLEQKDYNNALSLFFFHIHSLTNNTQRVIANRPEYLAHAARNYTLEQKDYNNALTGRLLEYATSCGYGNLLGESYRHDFGASFTNVRDRIRCYYKSFMQSHRRREQRKQRRQQKEAAANAAAATGAKRVQ